MQAHVPALPCDATELMKFCKRIEKEGIEQIFAMSVALHGKDVQEKQVIIDTTVQEKNIIYPTVGKVAIKMIHHLPILPKKKNTTATHICQRDKRTRIKLRFFRHPKKIKKEKPKRL